MLGVFFISGTKDIRHLHVSPEMTHLFGGGGWDAASEREGGRGCERDRDNLTGTVISHVSNDDQTDGAVEGVGSGAIDRGGEEAGLRLFGVRLGEAGRRGGGAGGGGDVSVESSSGVALTSNIEKLRHKCEQVVRVCSRCGCILVYLYLYVCFRVF